MMLLFDYLTSSTAGDPVLENFFRLSITSLFQDERFSYVQLESEFSTEHSSCARRFQTT